MLIFLLLCGKIQENKPQNEGKHKMKAVITVTGKDAVGIIAEISAACAENNANIVDITQSVMNEYFAMIMLVEINALNIKFADFADKLDMIGRKKGLVVSAVHEDIFNTMHHI